MTTVVIILAPSVDEFSDWCVTTAQLFGGRPVMDLTNKRLRCGQKVYHYVSSVEQLRGYGRDTRVVTLGNWEHATEERWEIRRKAEERFRVAVLLSE